ncbi:hypothetical protein D9599_03730 [Roseomonas sp. KE2513]|uniref:hypothetical protein n=1 Tax=Roseomonas sp. KE2513 TaxID=2479202 RepID=UPI0018E00DDD|nr:hypothetical protein [Roseomonas sp. KE2513]MBI0534679.1 hypothetical protein [Roseomonas sp. KE2513]
MDIAADQDAVQRSATGAGPGEGPLLRVLEASVSDRLALVVRALASGEPGGAPASVEISLDGVALGSALRRSDDAGRAVYTFHKDLGGALSHQGGRINVTPTGLAEMEPAMAPLGGRLGPASPAWFADATWTAESDVLGALENERPAVLLFGDVLPQSGAAAWAPVANLAAALREGGYRVAMLHFGEPTDCAEGVSAALRHLDVLHHHTVSVPQQAWSPEAPGSLPNVDRMLPQTLSGIAVASGAAMVIAVSATALGVLSKLPDRLPRAALLPRALVLAPRMIFSPVPREKAASTLRALLAHSTVLVDDEGLLVELAKWAPGSPAVVLPFGPALAARTTNPRGAADTVLALGAVAAEAVRRALPATERVVLLDDRALLDDVLDALARARLVVGWADAGLVGSLAWRIAARQGVPLVGEPAAPLPPGTGTEAAIAAVMSALTAFQDSGAAAAPATGGGWDAAAFAAELGLPPLREADRPPVPAFLRRLLATRLAGLADQEGVGLLVPPRGEEAMLLARAFAELGGKGRVFARNPGAGLPGVRPISQALTSGVHTVLMDVGEDREEGLAMMERVLESGLSPLPLLPQAAWTDRAVLTGWRGARAGTTAYVGEGPVPKDADLVLAPRGSLPPRADAVELSGPDDPCRGALLTIFAANDDAFWRRPPAPAIGYDRDAAATGLGIEDGLACPHPAVPMLALARHLGCTKVLLPAGLIEEPALGPALRMLKEAGISVDAVTTIPTTETPR